MSILFLSVAQLRKRQMPVVVLLEDSENFEIRCALKAAIVRHSWAFTEALRLIEEGGADYEARREAQKLLLAANNAEAALLEVAIEKGFAAAGEVRLSGLQSEVIIAALAHTAARREAAGEVAFPAKLREIAAKVGAAR